MSAVQRIVRLGHAARNSHALKVRQPLASVTLVTTDDTLHELVEPQIDVIREELNVRRVQWASERTAFVHHEVLPVFPVLGPRFGKRMPQVKEALTQANGDRLASELETKGRISLELAGDTFDLSSDELEVRLVERQGMATQGDKTLLVALDTELDEDLVAEGWSREVIHRIQSARKDKDLDYADRIKVRFEADDTLAAAIAVFRDRIADETLAIELQRLSSTVAELEARPVDNMHFALAIERV